MIQLLLTFVTQHPVAFLIAVGFLFLCWASAALISVMPPLPEGAGWWKTWAYNGAQVFGASFDKVVVVASKSKYVKELESKILDSSGTLTTQTSKLTVEKPQNLAPKVVPPSEDPALSGR